jgi:hypothetical protein
MVSNLLQQQNYSLELQVANGSLLHDRPLGSMIEDYPWQRDPLESNRTKRDKKGNPNVVSR